MTCMLKKRALEVVTDSSKPCTALQSMQDPDGCCHAGAGIADGVGAWIDMGVDPGIYARELMARCKEAAARVAPCRSAPVNILTNGFYDTTKMVPSRRMHA